MRLEYARATGTVHRTPRQAGARIRHARRRLRPGGRRVIVGPMHDAGEGSPALDIKALLQVALERAPHGDVEARVMARVALATTALEFARLIFAAPVRWLV